MQEGLSAGVSWDQAAPWGGCISAHLARLLRQVRLQGQVCETGRSVTKAGRALAEDPLEEEPGEQQLLLQECSLMVVLVTAPRRPPSTRACDAG